jgi:anti-anti-sigma regulatory factor
MNEADFSITIEGESMLVKLRGEIDMDTARSMPVASVRFAETLSSTAQVSISSTQVGSGSSSKLTKAFRTRGDRLTLRNLPAHIRRTSDIAGIGAVLDVE